MTKEKEKTLLLIRAFNLLRKKRQLSTTEQLEYKALLATMPKN